MKSGAKLNSEDSIIDNIHRELRACISEDAWRDKVWTAVMSGLDPNPSTRAQATDLLHILSQSQTDDSDPHG